MLGMADKVWICILLAACLLLSVLKFDVLWRPSRLPVWPTVMTWIVDKTDRRKDFWPAEEGFIELRKRRLKRNIETSNSGFLSDPGFLQLVDTSIPATSSKNLFSILLNKSERTKIKKTFKTFPHTEGSGISLDISFRDAKKEPLEILQNSGRGSGEGSGIHLRPSYDSSHGSGGFLYSGEEAKSLLQYYEGSGKFLQTSGDISGEIIPSDSDNSAEMLTELSGIGSGSGTISLPIFNEESGSGVSFEGSGNKYTDTSGETSGLYIRDFKTTSQKPDYEESTYMFITSQDKNIKDSKNMKSWTENSTSNIPDNISDLDDADFKTDDFKTTLKHSSGITLTNSVSQSFELTSERTKFLSSEPSEISDVNHNLSSLSNEGTTDLISKDILSVSTLSSTISELSTDQSKITARFCQSVDQCDSILNERCVSKAEISICDCGRSFIRNTETKICEGKVSLIGLLQCPEEQFRPELSIPSSPEYQNMTRAAAKALFLVLRNIQGMALLESQLQVIGFRSGSLVIEWRLDIPRSQQKTAEDIKDDISDILQFQKSSLRDSPVNLEGANILNISTDIDFCQSTESNYCSINALCVPNGNDSNNYECKCRKGFRDTSPNKERYRGEICEEICPTDYCGQYGTCMVAENEPTCRCQTWYIGTKCQVSGLVLGTCGGFVVAVILAIVILSGKIYNSRRKHTFQLLLNGKDDKMIQSKNTIGDTAV